MKVGVDMGATTAGASALLDLEELLATRLLVQGNSSWISDTGAVRQRP